MARRTKEEIQKEVAERSAQRKEEYFKAQAEAKTKAASTMTEVPKPDAYVYTNVWRQGVGTSGGYFSEIKTPNPYYDASTNTIVNPATGERTDAGVSMTSSNIAFPQGLTSVSGKSVTSVTRNSNGTYTVRYSDGSQTTSDVPPGSPAATVVTDPNAKDPVTGLTQAQKEAADALAKAKADSVALAAALGAQIDPNTGKIIPSTIDPAKAAIWYATQSGNTTNSNTTNTGFKVTNGKLYNNGQLFSGTYNGQLYENGVLKTSTSSDTSSSGSTVTSDPALLALIQSLQGQITSLSSTNQQAAINAAAAAEAAKKEKAENAISVLTARFAQYGLQSLVPKIRELAIGGATEATITLQLMESPEYKLRFKANQDRIKKGLAVLDPGDYIGIEDKYRQILRAYGLSQFDNDNYVSQFIANDVSAAELSSRVQTAVQRVQNADPAVLSTLTKYYGIGSSDLVGYVLDPEQQFQKIERQVAAAEIGAAAGLQGIQPGVAVAEQLAAQGVTKAEAQKGYATIADILPGAEKLSQIYGTTLEGYGLAEAEQEVFNTLASAQRKRRKLVEREVSAFSGASGLSKASLTQQVGGTF